MIEHHQGYTAIKRYGRNSFRPADKHPFKLIQNARTVKYDLIQQFEASTGIILPSGVKSNLCTQPAPNLNRELDIMKLQKRKIKNDIKKFE